MGNEGEFLSSESSSLTSSSLTGTSAIILPSTSAVTVTTEVTSLTLWASESTGLTLSIIIVQWSFLFWCSIATGWRCFSRYFFCICWLRSLSFCLIISSSVISSSSVIIIVAGGSTITGIGSSSGIWIVSITFSGNIVIKRI